MRAILLVVAVGLHVWAAAALTSGELNALASLRASFPPLDALWTGCLPSNPCSCERVECSADGSNVVALQLADLALSGPLPDAIGSFPQLQQLGLSNNRIEGTLPSSIGQLTELVSLSLSMNNFSGPLPDALGGLTKLAELSLSMNKFSGPLPAALGQLTSLVTLMAGDNLFSGPLPTSFGQLAALQYLDVHSNRLSGSIPPSFCGLASLVSFEIDRNAIGGRLPDCFGSLRHLSFFWASNNQLSGPIPASYASLANLVQFHVENNQLEGVVPPIALLPGAAAPCSVAGNKLACTRSTSCPDGLPSCPANATCAVWGDPHVTTFDGFTYGFQGVGDFYLAKPSAWATSAALSVQARFRRCLSAAGTCATAFAVADAGGRVELYFDPALPFAVKTFGVTVQPSAPGRYSVPGTGTLSAFGPAGLRPTAAVLELASGITVRFTGLGGLASVVVSTPGARAGSFSGLCGNFDLNAANDLTPASGAATPLPPTSSASAVYNTFGLSWRVPCGGDSLFDYGIAGRSCPEVNAEPDFSPTADAAATCPDALRAQADAACASCELSSAERAACVFDVCATGTPAAAAASCLQRQSTCLLAGSGCAAYADPSRCALACSYNGYCGNDAACLCNPGFTGADCSTRLASTGTGASQNDELALALGPGVDEKGVVAVAVIFSFVGLVTVVTVVVTARWYVKRRRARLEAAEAAAAAEASGDETQQSDGPVELSDQVVFEIADE